MVIQPTKIYKIKLRNGKEIIGQMVGEGMHSKFFKDQSGKKIEIVDDEIQSWEMLEDLTDKPYTHQDTDKKLKFRKSGQLVPAYKEFR